MFRQLNNALERTTGRRLLKPSHDDPDAVPPDLSPADARILRTVRPVTLDPVRRLRLVSDERVVALIDAVRYLRRAGISGTYVECGVFRGASLLTIALTLLDEGGELPTIYGYDTFHGMPERSRHDTDAEALPVGSLAVDEHTVRRTVESSGYPRSSLALIKGMVETTIPKIVPAGPIALLRLDTDFYESTKHELCHLYPKLVSGGILLLDDYGTMAGARRAADEWLASLSFRPYLHRVDSTGRLLVKP